MKYIFLFIVLFFSVTGCGLRERELEIKKRTNELNLKEQELASRERSLQLREEELGKKEKRLDSSSKNQADSLLAQYPLLQGKWNVTMNCTQTTCPGSAVGDTKNEQWEISFQNNEIVAQAFSNNKLIRAYYGTNNGTTVELSTKPDNPDLSLSTKMIVRLQEIKENEIHGQREIIRPDNCHIIYSLELKKQ